MKPLIVISRRDNVGTTQDALAPGDRVSANGFEIVAREPVPAGHKIAIAPIAAGAGVMKYGSAIGVATMDIEAGAHVHTHNVASTRGRGDLRAAGSARDSAARLAEPPDEAAGQPAERPANAEWSVSTGSIPSAEALGEQTPAVPTERPDSDFESTRHEALHPIPAERRRG